jgi:hypothetical protein
MIMKDRRSYSVNSLRRGKVFAIMAHRVTAAANEQAKPLPDGTTAKPVRLE